MEVSNWIRGLGSVFYQVSRGAKRSQRFKAAGNSPSVASVDVLEDRLLLTADLDAAPERTTIRHWPHTVAKFTSSMRRKRLCFWADELMVKRRLSKVLRKNSP